VGFDAHPSSIVEESAEIGDGTRIWHFCHVDEGAKIGKDCTIGQGCYIGKGVVIGDRVRLQNNVSVYTGVTLLDDVFVGPSVVFTNVRRPDPGVKVPPEQYERTVVGEGAMIGAKRYHYVRYNDSFACCDWRRGCRDEERAGSRDVGRESCNKEYNWGEDMCDERAEVIDTHPKKDNQSLPTVEDLYQIFDQCLDLDQLLNLIDHLDGDLDC